MQAITQNKPLTAINLSQGETILTPLTIEQVDKKMTMDWAIIPTSEEELKEWKWMRLSTARNIVRSYQTASSVQFYKFYILPSLPESIQSKMTDALSRIPEWVTPSLEAILEKQKNL